MSNVFAPCSSADDTLNTVLIDCVRAAGGSKRVGPALWPEKTPEQAQRTLLDCLNDERPAHLKPEQVLLVLRLARAAGHHEGVNWLLAHLGYAPTTPLHAQNEAAELQRQFLAAQAQMADMLAAMRALASRVEARA